MSLASSQKPVSKLVWTVFVPILVGVPLVVVGFRAINNALNSYQRSTVYDLVIPNCNVWTTYDTHSNNSEEYDSANDCLVDEKRYGWPIITKRVYIKKAEISIFSGQVVDVEDREMVPRPNYYKIRNRGSFANGFLMLGVVAGLAIITGRILSSKPSKSAGKSKNGRKK